MSARRVCFDSEMFGTGSADSSRVSICPKRYLQVLPPRGVFSYGVEPQRGGNSCNGVRFAFASEWGKSHQRSCEAGPLGAVNPCSRVRSPSGKISERSVLAGCWGVRHRFRVGEIPSRDAH